jgi:hypothetical protein
MGFVLLVCVFFIDNHTIAEIGRGRIRAGT